MSFDIKKWYKEKTLPPVVYDYMGGITEAQTTTILQEVESCLKQRNTPIKVLKKIFNITIELTQNLYHHGIVPVSFGIDNCKLGAFIITYEENCYKISSGNFVDAECYNQIKERLKQINNLSPEATKKLYLSTLNNDTFSNKGGGGLGIIDIALKSGNEINYNFYEYQSDYLFFALDILIAEKKK